jgi:hypothetical protein
MLCSISGGSRRWLSNGPPGAIRIMKKARVTMMNNVGIAPKPRRIAYETMDGGYPSGGFA